MGTVGKIKVFIEIPLMYQTYKKEAGIGNLVHQPPPGENKKSISHILLYNH